VANFKILSLFLFHISARQLATVTDILWFSSSPLDRGCDRFLPSLSHSLFSNHPGITLYDSQYNWTCYYTNSCMYMCKATI